MTLSAFCYVLSSGVHSYHKYITISSVVGEVSAGFPKTVFCKLTFVLGYEISEIKRKLLVIRDGTFGPW